MTLEQKIKIAVIGAGVRGSSLAEKLASSGMNASVAAVVEPDVTRREQFAEKYSLKSVNVFQSWEELFSSNADCNAVIIATKDNQHTGPALSAIEQGWNILLEKPVSDKFEDCLLIDKMCREKNIIISICHSLRYMEPFKKIKEIVESGSIGRIINIEHMEAIGNLRFTHNYVRGKWGREEANTFLLLHKCCHDIDFISWLMNENCLRVSSFGDLTYFNDANAPSRSGEYCIDDCSISGSCPYSASRLYIDSALTEWPARDVSAIHTRDAHLNAVRRGNWGKCVWHSDNNVVDHQVVMMEYENGATATCTLSGYSGTNGRRTRIHGTLGELLYDEVSDMINVKVFTAAKSENISVPKSAAYHPEDKDIVFNWLSAIQSQSGHKILVDTQEALKSHAIVFAAERSRKEKRTVDLVNFMSAQK